MLRFFRNIRQKLLDNGNIRKYFWYALGEIFLVMIGILLALQINNWNEERKTQIEEREILTSLYEDLQFAIAESKDMISRDSLDNVVMRDFLLGNDLNVHSENKETLDSLIILAIWGVGQSTPVIQTYNDIKSSGKTAVIRNEEIRNRLAFIESTSNGIRNSLNDKIIVQQFQVDNIIAKHLDMVGHMEMRQTDNQEVYMENDYESILSNKEMKNTIASKQLLSSGLYLERVAFQELLEELSGLIKNELEK